MLSGRQHQGQSGGGAEGCQLENKQGLAEAQYRSLEGQQDGVCGCKTPAVQVEKKGWCYWTEQFRPLTPYWTEQFRPLTPYWTEPLLIPPPD